MKSRNTAIATALALGLAFTGFAASQDRGPRPDKGEQRVERIAQRLDLDESQAEELTGKMRAHRETMAPSVEALREAQAALDNQITDVVFDETAIRNRAAAVAELQADLAVARALHAQELRELLTPEQYAELQKMHQRRARAMGGPGGPGGPGHRRGPAPRGR